MGSAVSLIPEGFVIEDQPTGNRAPTALPSGFVLEQPSVPEGFVIDEPSAAPSITPAPIPRAPTLPATNTKQIRASLIRDNFNKSRGIGAPASQLTVTPATGAWNAGAPVQAAPTQYMYTQDSLRNMLRPNEFSGTSLPADTGLPKPAPSIDQLLRAAEFERSRGRIDRANALTQQANAQQAALQAQPAQTTIPVLTQEQREAALGTISSPPAPTAPADPYGELMSQTYDPGDAQPNMDPRLYTGEAKKTFITALQEVLKNPLAKAPFVGGVEAGSENAFILQSINRAANGEPMEVQDFRNIQTYIDRLDDQEKDQTFAYTVGNLIASLPAFAVEFASTGGTYTIGKRTTRKAFGKAAENAVGRFARKWAGRAAGTAAQTAAMSPFRGVENISQRMLEGDEAGEAVVKGLADLGIEVASERTGYVFTRLLRGVPVPQRVKAIKLAAATRWMSKTGKTADEFAKYLRKAKWNGVLGEIFEEEVGGLTRDALNLGGDSITEKIASGEFSEALESFSAQALAFSVPGATQTAMRSFGQQPTQPQQETSNGQEVQQEAPAPVAEQVQQPAAQPAEPEVTPTIGDVRDVMKGRDSEAPGINPDVSRAMGVERFNRKMTNLDPQGRAQVAADAQQSEADERAAMRQQGLQDQPEIEVGQRIDRMTDRLYDFYDTVVTNEADAAAFQQKYPGEVAELAAAIDSNNPNRVKQAVARMENAVRRFKNSRRLSKSSRTQPGTQVAETGQLPAEPAAEVPVVTPERVQPTTQPKSSNVTYSSGNGSKVTIQETPITLTAKDGTAVDAKQFSYGGMTLALVHAPDYNPSRPFSVYELQNGIPTSEIANGISEAGAISHARMALDSEKEATQEAPVSPPVQRTAPDVTEQSADDLLRQADELEGDGYTEQAAQLRRRAATSPWEMDKGETPRDRINKLTPLIDKAFLARDAQEMQRLIQQLPRGSEAWERASNLWTDMVRTRVGSSPEQPATAPTMPAAEPPAQGTQKWTKGGRTPKQLANEVANYRMRLDDATEGMPPDALAAFNDALEKRKSAQSDRYAKQVENEQKEEQLAARIADETKQIHDLLTASGAELQKESEAGSRYYRLADGKMVRVSDHDPNEATSAWIDRNDVVDLRVGTRNVVDYAKDLVAQGTPTPGEAARTQPTPPTGQRNAAEGAGPDKSEGHIAFANGMEYYTASNGDIHRAPISNPVMTDGRRSGRFEATQAAKQALLKMLGVQQEAAPAPTAPPAATVKESTNERPTAQRAPEDAEAVVPPVQPEVAEGRGTQPAVVRAGAVGQEGAGQGAAQRVDKRTVAFRRLADGLQKQIDEKRNPGVSRQNVTARRARIAAGMADDADHLERIQQAMNRMADAIESGTLPDSLSKVTSRAQVEDLLRTRYPAPYANAMAVRDLIKALAGKPGIPSVRESIGYIGDGYLTQRQAEAIAELVALARKYNVSYSSYNISIGEAARLAKAGITNGGEFAKAHDDLKAMTSGPSAEVLAERKRKDLERGLIGAKIPGFFPTPKPVIGKLLDAADIQPGMSVLEPSAGKGDIADQIRENHPSATLSVVEVNSTLRDVLNAKGYEVADQDFLAHNGKYDRIVMNPPFEGGAEMAHVRHAYDLLKPGGRVVSVMSEGPFFRSDKSATEFREWIDSVGGVSEKLPQGSFSGSEAFRQTGTATRMVVIDKPSQSGVDAAPSTGDMPTSPTVTDYTANTVVVRGDRAALADKMKAIGARWSTKAEGYVVNKAKRAAAEAALTSQNVRTNNETDTTRPDVTNEPVRQSSERETGQPAGYGQEIREGSRVQDIDTGNEGIVNAIHQKSGTAVVSGVGNWHGVEIDLSRLRVVTQDELLARDSARRAELVSIDTGMDDMQVWSDKASTSAIEASVKEAIAIAGQYPSTSGGRTAKRQSRPTSVPRQVKTAQERNAVLASLVKGADTYRFDYSKPALVGGRRVVTDGRFVTAIDAPPAARDVADQIPERYTKAEELRPFLAPPVPSERMISLTGNDVGGSLGMVRRAIIMSDKGKNSAVIVVGSKDGDRIGFASASYDGIAEIGLTAGDNNVLGAFNGKLLRDILAAHIKIDGQTPMSVYVDRDGSLILRGTTTQSTIAKIEVKPAEVMALAVREPSSRNRGMVNVEIIADSIDAALAAGKWTASTAQDAARWLAQSVGNRVVKASEALRTLTARFGRGIRKFFRQIWTEFKATMARDAIGAVGRVSIARIARQMQVENEGMTRAEATEKASALAGNVKEAGPTPKPTVKQVIRENVQQTTGMGDRTVTKTEAQTLQMRMREQAKGQKEGFKQGYREALTAISKSVREGKASEQGIRVALSKFVREYLPKDLQAEMLVQVRDATTLGKLANGIRTIRALAADRQLRTAVAQGKAFDSKKVLVRLENTRRDQFMQVLEGVRSLIAEAKATIPALATLPKDIPALTAMAKNRGLSYPANAKASALRRIIRNDMIQVHIAQNQALATKLDEAAEQLLGIIHEDAKARIKQFIVPKQKEAATARKEIYTNLAAMPDAPRISGREDGIESERRPSKAARAGRSMLTPENEFGRLGDKFTDLAVTKVREAHGEAYKQDAADEKVKTAAFDELGITPEQARSMSHLLSDDYRTIDIKTDAGRTMKATPMQLVGLIATLRDRKTRAQVVGKSGKGGRRVTFDSAPLEHGYLLSEADVSRIENTDPVLSQLADKLATHIRSKGRMIDTILWRLRGFGILLDSTYYPRHSNVEQSKDKGDPKGATADVLPRDFRESTRRLLENLGIGQERTEYTGTPLLVKDALVEFDNYNHNANMLIHLAEPLRTVTMVSEKKDVKRLIGRKLGVGQNERIKRYTAESAGTATTGSSKFDKASRGIARSVSSALIASNVKSWTKNAIGGSMSLLYETSLTHWKNGMKYIADSSIDQRLQADSGHFVRRHTLEPEKVFSITGFEQTHSASPSPLPARRLVKEILANLARGRFGRAADAQRELVSKIRGMTKADQLVARHAYGIGRSEVEEAHPDWSEERKHMSAVKRAEQLFFRTQNGNEPTETAGYISSWKQSGYGVWHTMFASEPSKQLNSLYRNAKRGKADLAKALGVFAANKAVSVGTNTLFKYMPIALAVALGLRRWDDDDTDKLIERTSVSLLRDTVGTVPMGDNLVSTIYSGVKGWEPDSLIQSIPEQMLIETTRGVGELAHATALEIEAARTGEPTRYVSGKNKGKRKSAVLAKRGADRLLSYGSTLLGMPIAPPYSLARDTIKPFVEEADSREVSELQRAASEAAKNADADFGPARDRRLLLADANTAVNRLRDAGLDDKADDVAARALAASQGRITDRDRQRFASERRAAEARKTAVDGTPTEKVLAMATAMPNLRERSAALAQHMATIRKLLAQAKEARTENQRDAYLKRADTLAKRLTPAMTRLFEAEQRRNR